MLHAKNGVADSRINKFLRNGRHARSGLIESNTTPFRIMLNAFHCTV